MLRPTAIRVAAICAYQILVEFDNGEKKQFDVEPYIKGEWYGKLRSFEYFKCVSTDGCLTDKIFVLMNCITWGNWCPDNN